MEKIIEHCFPFQPDAVLAQEDCDLIYNKQGEVVEIYKQLSKMVRHPRVTQARHGAAQVSLSSVLVLDDNAMTFSKNDKNAIHIPPFCPHPTIDGLLSQDHALDSVQAWLLERDVMRTNDYRLIPQSRWPRERIFCNSFSQCIVRRPNESLTVDAGGI